MKVYIKNQFQQQTVRNLPIFQAIKLRLYVFMKYQGEERPIVKFLV